MKSPKNSPFFAAPLQSTDRSRIERRERGKGDPRRRAFESVLLGVSQQLHLHLHRLHRLEQKRGASSSNHLRTARRRRGRRPSRRRRRWRLTLQQLLYRTHLLRIWEELLPPPMSDFPPVLACLTPPSHLSRSYLPACSVRPSSALPVEEQEEKRPRTWHSSPCQTKKKAKRRTGGRGTPKADGGRKRARSSPSA